MKLRSRSAIVGAALLAAGTACGCGRDTRLSGTKVRDVKVRTVTHYGVTLGQEASPEQVAYVVLRAVRDDFNAKTAADRDAALDIQFDLCAAGELASRNRTSLTAQEFIHNVVYRWTPTVSHYVGDLPLDWESANSRLVRRTPTEAKNARAGGQECELAMEVADPGGDPNARVLMLIWLAQDAGYWRIVHFGFEPKRSLASRGPAPVPTRDPSP